MKRRRPASRAAPASRIEADPSAPLVLAIDASGPVESVALAQGELVLASSSRRRARGRGSALAARVRDVLQDAGRRLEQLAGVACVVGPGSFTGIRVGVATAQGLASALGVPTLSWTATEAWALAVQGSVVVTLDARRGEVYGQALCAAPGGGLESILPLRLCAPEPWFEACRELRGALVVGDGARLYRQRMEASWGVAPRLAEAVAGPAMGAVAARSAQRLSVDPGLASEPLRPIYLRDHDAAKPVPR